MTARRRLVRRAVRSTAVLAALAAALSACGDDAAPPAANPPGATPEAGTPATPFPVEGLAIGITEPNPNFVWPAAAKALPEPFERWRAALERMSPHVLRLVLNWPVLQPEAAVPPDLDLHVDGCSRDVHPCAGYAGVREQLRALAAAQRAHPGRWQALVVVTGTPDWAAEAPTGCEEPGALPRSRAVREDALPAYRALVASVLAVAREEGAELRYWSAWNEPNHPYFVSPQRTACAPDAPTAAVEPYVRLVRELRTELDVQPGEQQLALGELAGYVQRGPFQTAVQEFIAGLPDDVVCASPIWSQHSYVIGRRGSPEVDAALRALDGRGCPRRHEVWITETGVGAPRRGPDPARGTALECRAMEARLRDWYASPRVSAAFQYTLRADDRFPTGLLSSDLTQVYPVLGLWAAWSEGRDPGDPPPPSPCPVS